MTPGWAERHIGWTRSLDGGLQAAWDQALVQQHKDGSWWIKAGLVKIQNRLKTPEFDAAVDWRVAPTDYPRTKVLEAALEDLARLAGGAVDLRVKNHGNGWLVVVIGSTAAEVAGA